MVCLMMVNIILQKICLGELLLTPVYFLKITCNTNALDAQFVVTGIIRVIIAMDCNDSRFESRSMPAECKSIKASYLFGLESLA